MRCTRHTKGEFTLFQYGVNVRLPFKWIPCWIDGQDTQDAHIRIAHAATCIVEFLAPCCLFSSAHFLNHRILTTDEYEMCTRREKQVYFAFSWLFLATQQLALYIFSINVWSTSTPFANVRTNEHIISTIPLDAATWQLSSGLHSIWVQTLYEILHRICSS